MNRQQEIADAMQRAADVLTRRPDMGVHDDAFARATWHAGTRVSTHHANGFSTETDMPRELGGSGDRVSPGWLFRAGIAACANTCIAMVAASEGIVLDHLDVVVSSQSDTRGFLGMREADGSGITAGALGMQLQVHIAAPGVSAARLQQLVNDALARSPMQVTMARPPTLAVSVTTDDARAA